MKVVFDTHVPVSALVFPGGRGHADAIVTGDKELLALGEYGGARILTLRDYLA